MPTTDDLAEAVFCNLVLEDLAYRVSAKRFPGKARLIKIIRKGTYFNDALNLSFFGMFFIILYQTCNVYKLTPFGRRGQFIFGLTKNKRFKAANIRRMYDSAASGCGVTDKPPY